MTLYLTAEPRLLEDKWGRITPSRIEIRYAIEKGCPEDYLLLELNQWLRIVNYLSLRDSKMIIVSIDLIVPWLLRGLKDADYSRFAVTIHVLEIIRTIRQHGIKNLELDIIEKSLAA